MQSRARFTEKGILSIVEDTRLYGVGYMSRTPGYNMCWLYYLEGHSDWGRTPPGGTRTFGRSRAKGYIYIIQVCICIYRATI